MRNLLIAAILIALILGLVSAVRNRRGVTPGRNWQLQRQNKASPAPNEQTHPISIPGEFQSLYILLEGKLDSFLQKVDSSWNGSKHPVVWSAGLITANPNAGDVLLQPSTFETTVKYLDRLKDLGVKGVAVDINFPLLDPQFYSDQSKYNQYLDFYKRLFAEIKKRGMIVEVEVQPIFPDYSSLDVRPYFQSLTFEEYKTRVLEQCKIIAKELKPEYLTVANEPETAAHNSGQPLQILDNYIQEVQHVVDGLENAGFVQNIKLGAGFGTWYKDYKGASSRLAQMPNLDFINIHIYPVDGGLLERALEISDIAAQNGKKVAIHESWLYKWKLGEGKDQGIGAAGNIYARDIFSFWQPLDKKFVEALYKMGNYKKMEYVSFFWSNYFFMYGDYETLQKGPGMSYAIKEGAKAALEGKTTETGVYYQNLISGN